MRLRLVLVCMLFCATASARPRVEVKPNDAGGEIVTVDGTARWRGAHVTSPLAWAKDGSAVAFTARVAGGAQLVVLLLEGDGAPEAMTWPIPASAGNARAVTWLAPNRVAAGPSEFEPRVLASWQVSSR